MITRKRLVISVSVVLAVVLTGTVLVGLRVWSLKQPVATIAGSEVTRRQWENALVSYRSTQACVREKAALAAPASGVAQVSGAAAPKAQPEPQARFLTLRDQFEDEVVVFANLMIGRAVDAEIASKQANPDEAALAKQVEAVKKALEPALAQDAAAQNCTVREIARVIAEYGAPVYWDTVLPEQQRKGLATANLYKLGSVKPVDAAKYQINLAREADVEMSRRLRRSVSMDDVLAYLEGFERASTAAVASP